MPLSDGQILHTNRENLDFFHLLKCKPCWFEEFEVAIKIEVLGVLLLLCKLNVISGAGAFFRVLEQVIWIVDRFTRVLRMALISFGKILCFARV